MSPRTGESGTPEIVEGDVKNCDTCHGYGTAEVWDPETEMYVPGNCTACGGSGQVEGQMHTFECETCGEQFEAGVEEPCPACGSDQVVVVEFDPGVDRDADYDLSKSFRPPAERQDENRELETDGFNKFMDRIVGEENQRAKADPKAEGNPQRQRAARYQDRPMNKTRWGVRR